MALVDFSLRELALVAVLLRAGSVREVASRHGAEAGNLSRLLKRLEADCGQTLAMRSRAGLAPSEAGHRLSTQISRVVEQAWTVDEAQNGDGDQVPLLGIGAVPFRVELLL